MRLIDLVVVSEHGALAGSHHSYDLSFVHPVDLLIDRIERDGVESKPLSLAIYPAASPAFSLSQDLTEFWRTSVADRAKHWRSEALFEDRRLRIVEATEALDERLRKASAENGFDLRSTSASSRR